MIKKIIGKVIFNFISYFRMQLYFLTVNEKKFIEINSAFWKEYQSNYCAPKDEYVFIRPEQYPLILVGLAHIATCAALNKNARSLFIIHSRFDRAMKKVLNSFPNSTFIYEDSWRYLIFKVYSCFQAIRAMRLFKNPEDVLTFKSDGILVGDLIYDTFLVNNKSATMYNVKDGNLLKTLQEFFYQRSVIRDIVKRYKIIMGLTGHIIGTGGGFFQRYLLHNNLEVWEKADTLKKYKKINQIHECWVNPDKRYIDFMKQKPDYFIPLAEQCLKKKLENSNLEVKLDITYRHDRKVFYSREEFSHYFNLDSKKKNVFVMLQAFNDFPHVFGFMIYRDFYEWFKVVLEIAQENDSVNWIFKQHPYEKFYPIKDVNLKSIFLNIASPNILFLNNDIDFNTSSLCYIADSIITCIGTAGLEYSAYGIPCVLGGDCWYFGFGFTIEPKTDMEFREVLKNIATLPRLNKEQINMAKLISFFTFEMVEPTQFPDPFGIVPTHNFIEQKTFSLERIFECIVTHRSQSGMKDKMEYIESLNEFIFNPSYTQFIDLRKYGFFRKVFSNFYDKKLSLENIKKIQNYIL